MFSRIQFFFVLIALFLLIGCQGGEVAETAVPTPEPTATSAPTPTPEPTYAVSVWAANIRGQTRQAIRDNINAIDEVNFVWYSPLIDGTLRISPSAGDEDVMADAAELGYAVVPTIHNNFDRDIVAAIIHDDEIRQLHVQTIVDEVLKHDFDGIDIDYEGLWAEDRSMFTLFMEELSAAMHAEGKIVSMALHAKTEEPGTWEAQEAQDWAALGAVVDEFKIMTYDYHNGLTEAGSIAPFDWVDEVLTFAATVVPPEKTYMGIHFYGRDWVGSVGEAKEWIAIQSTILRYEPEITRDEFDEAVFTYGSGHTVHFPDAKSLQSRLETIMEKHPDIAGIAIWRVGGEDPENWRVIANELK